MSEIIPLSFSQDKILSRIPDSYHPEASAFLSLVQEKGLSPETMDWMVKRLTEEGKKASTINKNISAMRAVVRAIYKTGSLPPAASWEIEENLKKIRFVKKVSRAVMEQAVLTEKEYVRMRNSASPRTSLVLAFLWETGCRVSEALNVRLSACKMENGVVRIYITGKGRKERVLRIRPDLFQEIRETFPGEVYLFESRRKGRAGQVVPLHDRGVDKEIRRIGKEILGEERNVHPHMFRHSFATRMIGKGVDVKAVSTYLGHSTTAITMDLYVHTEPTNEELGILS